MDTVTSALQVRGIDTMSTEQQEQDADTVAAAHHVQDMATVPEAKMVRTYRGYSVHSTTCTGYAYSVSNTIGNKIFFCF